MKLFLQVPARIACESGLTLSRLAIARHPWDGISDAVLAWVNHELTFWRTHAGHEVDFVVGDDIAVEVKATTRVSPRDLKGLTALAEEVPLKQRLVVANELRTRTLDDGVVVLPVETFLRRLWADDIVG